MFIINIDKEYNHDLYITKKEILGFGNVSYISNNPQEGSTKITSYTQELFSIENNKLTFPENSSIDAYMWYHIGSKKLIFSNRQDFIIASKENFHLNQEAVKWFVNTGTLGPNNSIDTEITYKSHTERLQINLVNFEVSKERVSWEKPYEINNPKEEINAMFEKTFSELEIDSNTALSLSAGIDSRLAYSYIQEQGKEVKTVTWGVVGDETNPKTDAFIANELATKISKEHYYLPIKPIEDYKQIIKEIIINCDGRVDHFHAHTDAYANFKEMNMLGIKKLIRGDETFGWVNCTTVLDAKIGVGLQSLSEYKNFDNAIFEKYEIDTQKNFPKTSDVSISEYRDFLYREYRIPFIIAPLSTMKERYVKTLNPFLNKEIVNFFINLDNSLKDDKKLIRDLANDKIGITTNSSVNNEQTELFKIMLLPENQEYIKSKINNSIIPTEISNWLLQKYNSQIEIPPQKNGKLDIIKNSIKKILPYKVKKLLRNTVVGYELNPLIVINRVIALDLYINYCQNIKK